MLVEGWLSQVESTGEWKSLPFGDPAGLSAPSEAVPALSRAETVELRAEGGEHATEQA